MALFSILRFPDPRLRKIATPVSRIDAAVRALAADMAETMYAAPGIGLAATQIDVHRQIVVIDISEARDQLRVFINPRITHKDGQQVYEEGCLSVPGIYEKVERAATVRVEYLDLDAQPQCLDADGLLAVCVQHELDHLQGKVFVDHLSRLKQTRIRDKLVKQARKSAL
jgi:peptide deformylase